jgi:hypothetical protein
MTRLSLVGALRVDGFVLAFENHRSHHITFLKRPNTSSGRVLGEKAGSPAPREVYERKKGGLIAERQKLPKRLESHELDMAIN